MDVDRLIEIARTIFLVAMSAGVYFEAGPFTVVLVCLIVLRVEDITEATNINSINVNIIADFLDEKHEDFIVEDEEEK